MAEVTLGRSKTPTHEFGISMPKNTIDRINAVKGPYITRSKFILRAVDKALQEVEQEKMLQGADGLDTPKRQVAFFGPHNTYRDPEGDSSSHVMR
jgi:hypothetical protein